MRIDVMKTATFGLALALGLGLAACDDPVSTPGEGEDMGTGGTGGMAPTPDAMPEPEPQMEPEPPPPPPPEPAFIDVELDPRPRDGLYTLASTPTLVVTVYDRVGQVIDASDRLYYDVQPPGQGELADDLTLTFLREGQGAVRACVTSDLCGRANFFVDDAPPALELISPARGDIVSGEPRIAIEGQTDPAPNSPRVFVNDQQVEVDGQGRFTTEIRASLGLNRIDVVADDGVRRPPTRVIREVVWAPEVLVPDPNGVSIDNALVLRLDQSLLDLDEPPPAPDEMGAQAVTDLAGTIEIILSRVELLGLVPDPVIADDENLSLTIENILPGTADVAISLVPDGMELFLRLEDLTLVTAGRVALEGVDFDLGGAVRVTAAAFAGITIEPGPDGAPVLRVGEIGIAIEGLGGEMNDSTAQALVDTFGSLVRTVLDAFATDLVQQVVRDEVPEFIELGLGDALGPLANIPLDVEEPPIALDLGFTLADPRITARDALTLTMTGAIRQRMPVEPPYPSPGIPAVGLDADPIWPNGAGLGVAVRMVVINALLDALWRQGALALDLGDFLPPAVAGLISGGRVDARIAPLVVPGARGGPYAFELQVGELDLYLESPNNPEPDQFVLSLRAGMILEVGEGRIRFDVAEEPDLRMELVQAGGPTPVLPADTLARLIGPVAWGEVRAAVGEGLDLALDPIVIGRDAFAEIAPSIESIDVQPGFPAPATVRNGYFVLGAGVEITVR